MDFLGRCNSGVRLQFMVDRYAMYEQFTTLFLVRTLKYGPWYNYH